MKMRTFGISLFAAAVLVVGCGDDDKSSTSSDDNVLVINEYKANIPEDEHSKQYIELRGTPGMEIAETYLVVVDGDEDSEGHVDYACNLSGVTVGDNGLIILKNADEYNDVISSETTVINDPLIRTYDPDVDGDELEDGILEHDAITYMLIRSSSEIQRGDDLDSDNDGALELPEGAEVIDSLGSLDGGDGYVYGDIVLTQSASDPDAASRFYDDMTPNSLDAWANGDIYEDPSKEDEELPDELLYDTLQASSNLPPKAALTPGNHNFKKAPFILINEVVAEDSRYVELLSNAAQDFESVYLLVFNDDTGAVATSVDLDGQQAKETGITIITDSAASITTGSAMTAVQADLSGLSATATSVLLVYSPDHGISAGDDLDEDSDGSVDLPEGAILLDNIGWGATTYSDIVTDSTTAAIRYKDNKMVAKSAWSFDSSYITPAGTNIAETAQMLVEPVLETDRTTASNPDADDVAFWIHPTDSSKSMVIGTQKIAGYSVYDVDGNTLLDFKPEDNRYNNVDVMYGFELNGETVDLAIFTDRIFNKFIVYVISETAPYLTDVTDYDNTEELFEAEDAGEDTAYGLAVYKSVVDGSFYVYASQNGTYLAGQYKLKANGDKIGWDKIRTITLAGGDDDEHAEGMVVDQEYGKLYIAQEPTGIYLMDAEPGDNPADVVLTEDDMLMEEGDHGIVEDIEGATIYYKDNGEGYYIVSSQGNYTYGVFNRTPNGETNEYLTSFAIVDDMNGIDGVQETDSVDVTNIAFGDQFPYGVFIVQDGMDTTSDPDDTETNFKWVPWESIGTGLGDLAFESSYDPRNPVNHR